MADAGARERLVVALAPVARRLRVSRALGILGPALVAAWSVLAIGLAVRFGLGQNAGRLVVAAAVTFVAVVAWASSKRVELGSAARLADESHGLDDRLGSAVDFVAKPSSTEFERAAIDDALARTAIDPARAVPFVVPGRVPVMAALVLATAAIVLVPTSRPRGSDRGPTNASRRASVDAETLEASRADLDRLRRQSRGRAIEPDLAALEAVLDALERGTIDTEEAFRRLDEIGRRVASEPRGDSRVAALEAAANALGDRSRRLDAVVEAMRRGDSEAASQALAEVARAMAGGEIDRRELDRIRESFERMGEAARQRDERRDELLRRRDELRRALEEEDEPSLLDRHRRELERLERELEDLEESRRELERLEREMRESAEDLNRDDASSAAQDLEDAFEDLNRMRDEEMDDEAREQMQQQLEQLREALRRQRSSGGGEQEQEGGSGSSGMQRYRLRAGGGGAGGRQVVLRTGGPPGEGAEGQSGSGQGSEGQSGTGQGGEGQNGEQPGQGGQPGGAGSGAGGGSGEGDGPLVLDLRPGAEGGEQVMLELPNGGRPSPSGRGGGGQPGRDTSGYGTDHRPESLETATDLDSSGESSHVDGEHGAGETRSQVIRGAASSGFAGRGYRSVHADYSDHAEEVLDRENVPPGYRYYVRRYFQMIRPREESNP